MAFIITTSRVEDDNFGKATPVQMVRRATPEEGTQLLAGAGTAFKLYDDDGELYLLGKYLGDADSEEAFEPLDWAAGLFGCTRIDYRQADGTYATL